MNEVVKTGKDLVMSMGSWWESHPLWYNVLSGLGIFFTALWGEVSVFIFSMLVLTFLDTHFGIKASHKKGIKFNSKLRRKGILDKWVIYLTIITLTLLVDSMALEIYDFGRHYLTVVMLLFAGLYEATSIVEKLKIIYPESRLINRLGRLFMLFESDLDGKLDKVFEDSNEEIKNNKDANIE